MVRGGLVGSVQEAFELWLASGRPAFVPRIGPDAATVVQTIHDAGGLASFAHPGVTNRNDLVAPLAERGLDAIEVYHSDHTLEDTTAYRRLAARFGLLVTGGSDFHGDNPAKPESTFAKATVDRRARRSIFGAISLPPSDFAALEQRSRVTH
jgi:predicted metal-dependent phosphoesterase TrpH